MQKSDLLLVHGWLSNWNLWGDPSKETCLQHILGEYFNLFAVNLPERGLGSIDSSTTFIKGVIDYIYEHNGNRKISVLTHSLGGVVLSNLIRGTPGYDKKIANLTMLASPLGGSYWGTAPAPGQAEDDLRPNSQFMSIFYNLPPYPSDIEVISIYGTGYSTPNAPWMIIPTLKQLGFPVWTDGDKIVTAESAKQTPNNIEKPGRVHCKIPGFDFKYLTDCTDPELVDNIKESLNISDPKDIINPDPTFISPTYRGVLPLEVGERALIYLSPLSSPGENDTLNAYYPIHVDCLVNISVYDTNGKILKRIFSNELKPAGDIIFSWDGKNEEGKDSPEGLYTAMIEATSTLDATQKGVFPMPIIIDNTPPVASIDYFKMDSPASGLISIMGQVTDKNFDYYSVEYGQGDNPTEWVEISGSFEEIEDELLAVLDTSEWPSGLATIRLIVYDLAGNSSISTKELIIEKNIKPGLRITLDSVEYEESLGEPGTTYPDNPFIWVEDNLPEGSTPINTWTWDSSVKYSGALSHTDGVIEGTHHHYFIHTDKTLDIKTDVDYNLIQYVYLDPVNPPKEILLQFYIGNGDGEHRCYWGKNLIQTGGISGTASLYYMGSLPPTGEWIRLKIPASALGLVGERIKGMLYGCYERRKENARKR